MDQAGRTTSTQQRIGIRAVFGDQHARRRLQQGIGSLSLHVLATLVAFVFAMPLLWAFSTSLKTVSQVYTIPPEWIPNPVVWRNYPEALTRVPFLKYVVNTFKVAIPNVVGALVSSAIPAYGFSRIKWKFRDAFFFVCLATMMIPFHVRMIPLFIIFKKLGWINTYLPLIVPGFLGQPYTIFLMRQFFLTIPQDLSDAARADGCSEWGILARIIIPLSVPVLAVIGVFQFMWTWNDYLGPLVYLSDENLYTVAIGLTRYQAGGYSQAKWSFLMAASVVTITPILLLFFFAQRTFIEGITLTGIKG